jgi:long-chain acyl-CoA synthetase
MNSPIRNTSELYKFFHRQTASLTNGSAVSTSEGALSFAEIFSFADQLAEQLAKAGICEGDTIGLAMPNSLSFVPSFLALLNRSTTIALVSPKYRESELQAIVEGVRPRCFLTTASLARLMANGIRAEKNVVVSLPSLGEELVLLYMPSSSTLASPRTTIQNAAALIKFTSGSTGTPKGIALTIDNVLAEAENVVNTLGITPDDCILAPVPIFHSYGFDLGVLSMLYSGARLSIREAFIPRRLLADLASPDVSIFLGVPSMYHIFTETLLPTIPDLSHVRFMLSCTAPLSPDLIDAFFEKFHMPICQHYGSSETGAATNHAPASVLERKDSVGQAMQNVTVRIINDEGQPLPAGEVGEVMVTSRVVAPGYIMGDSAGQARFSANTYKTGDLGFMDSDGFLFLRGRKDDMINVGGLKVSPFEVAQVLQSHSCVREAAVAGVKDAMGEEVVYAVVTLKTPASEQDLLSFCRARLSEYKVPRRIDIVEEMPRGPSGKIKIDIRDVQL